MRSDETMLIYNNVKNVILYLRRGFFLNFLNISQLIGPLQKKKNPQNIHPQLIHITLQEGLAIKDIQ
jgi:hypothetical protein